MPFHPVQNTVEVKFHGDRAGDPRITTLHYRYGPIGGPRPTQPELQDLVHDCRVNVLPYLLQGVQTGTRWTRVEATDIHDANGLHAEEVLNPTPTGGRTGEALPGNVQMCLTKRTNLAQRRGRGRIFVPDLVEGDQNDSIIGSSLQAILLDLGAHILQNRGLLRNFVAVVASKKFGSFAPLLTITFDLITDSLRPRLKEHRRVRRRQTTT